MEEERQNAELCCLDSNTLFAQYQEQQSGPESDGPICLSVSHSLAQIANGIM
jgi:hypothetical protein